LLPIRALGRRGGPPVSSDRRARPKGRADQMGHAKRPADLRGRAGISSTAT